MSTTGITSEHNGAHASKRRKLSANLGTTHPPKQRRRIACRLCRLKKARCDAGRPRCGFCKFNDTECEYEESDQNEDDTSELTEAFVVDHLRRILHGVDSIRTNLHSKSSHDEVNNNAYKQHLASDITGTNVALGRYDNQRAFFDAPAEVLENRQPARDYLRIPTCQATADTLLTWPIFKSSYPPDALINHFFQTPETAASAIRASSAAADTPSQSEVIEVEGGMRELPEERIPILIDRFLQNVHTKNPILDVDALVLKGRKVSVRGLSWDADSCLVLLACALGSISFPFVRAMQSLDMINQDSSSEKDTDLQMGETCFVLALRRLGLLKYTIIGAQCQFFAAVYLMYTFRPLQAWNYFIQSSTYYQFFLRSVGGPSSEHPTQLDMNRQRDMTRLQRRLEQSLYWSCFKSEVEMRIELPLVQSTLSNFEYPAPFPSPPSTDIETASESAIEDDSMPFSLRQAVDAEYSSSIRRLRNRESSGSLPIETQELRKHSRSLYNEEESWYYYLTEVALRRISNRIINTFFGDARASWMDIAQFIPIALEFDEQISAWSANLPPAMQAFAMPESPEEFHERSQGDVERFSVSKELSWCTENRILEMRSWMYQPFLYYITHENMLDTETYRPRKHLSSTQRQALDRLVQEGIDCNLKTLDWRTIPHRHHGIWFDLRAVVTAVITLCAIARSDASRLPDNLFMINSQSPSPNSPPQSSYCINIDVVIRRLRYWEEEALDMRRARVLLEELIQDTRSLLGLV